MNCPPVVPTNSLFPHDPSNREIANRAKRARRRGRPRRFLLCAILFLFALPAFGQGTGLVPQDLSTGLTPNDLVSSLLGQNSSAVVSNVSFVGDARCAGRFSGGTGILGFEKGIVLSTGQINDVVGPNVSDATTTGYGTSGDPDLDTIATAPTFDACTIEFDFECPGVDVVSFTYQFTSEEHNEFSNSFFNNVFGFFLNGTNIAVLPGGLGPVSINNVNLVNNPSYYINNDASDLPAGSLLNIEADGLTVVLGATDALNPATNHIKIAIADSGDSVYDSWVFLKGGSFQCTAPPAPATTPLPTVSEEAPGLAADSRTGTAVDGAGDLDGDGIDDFVAGSPGYEDAAKGIPVEAGAASVFFGSTVSAERTAADITFTGVSAHDRMGVSVASGFDFNGDGFNDIFIGGEQVNRSGTDDPAAGCDDQAPCGEGLAILVFFNPNDTALYPNIGDPNIPDFVDLGLLNQSGGPTGIRFTGVEFGDQVGFAVAGGGFPSGRVGPDIAIGAPSRDVDINLDGTVQCVPGVDESECDAGSAYLIFSDTGLGGTISLSRVANGDFDEVDGIRYEGAGAGDALGFSVAFPGDVVEPAGEDFAMGAPLVDTEDGNDATLTDAGTAYLDAGGTLSKGIIEVCRIGADLGGAQIYGDQAGEQLGYSIGGGGDNQGDGETDLLIGAPTYDSNISLLDATETDVGRVVHTAGTLSKGVIEVCRIGADLATDQTAIAGAQYIGAETGDLLGVSVAGLGDTTANGSDDIGLGAPGVDVDTGLNDAILVDAGSVYVVQGDTSGANDAPLSKGIIEVDRIGVDTPGRVLSGTQAGEEAGASIVGAGDLNADGRVDFVVGSPGKDLTGNDDGNVSVVLQGDLLNVTQPNQAPVAIAGLDLLLECAAGGSASANLDGSQSNDPDSTPGTQDDIASYGWYTDFGLPGESLLGSSAQISASFPIGSTTVVLEIADFAGLLDNDDLVVTVQDTQMPSVTCPPDTQVECESASQAAVDLESILADDVCDGAVVTITNDRTANGDDIDDSYPLGTTTVNADATDVSGNVANCATDVTVADTTPPAITCPGDVVSECVSAGQAGITLADATATDACQAGVTIDNDLTSGANASGSYGLGTTVITFTATDPSGNVSSCETSVTVQDTTAPVVTVTPSPDELWPPNHKMSDVHYEVIVTDDCDPGPVVVLDTLGSSELDDKPGRTDGKTSNDIQQATLGTPDYDVRLRSERDGEGVGRIYTATYAATDAAGNTGTGAGDVLVPHDQDPEPLMIAVASNSSTLVSWELVGAAVHYDVVRGDVRNLQNSGSDIDLGPVSCIEGASVDSTTTGYEDQAAPAPGEAFFYVVQYDDGEAHTSYGTETAGKARVVGSGDCD